MANLQALKSRIDSIDKTASITKAMYRIASSKLVSSQEKFKKYHIFKNNFDEVLKNVLKYYDIHPFMKKENESKRSLYILISADRGLVGSYHQNLFKGFLNLIQDKDKENILIVAIGKKAFSFAQKNGLKLVNEKVILNPDQVQENIFSEQITKVIDMFVINKIGSIYVYSTQFINSIKQIPVLETILPIDYKKEPLDKENLLFEGKKENILKQVIHIYLQSRLYGLLIDAKLSEFSSRILAMKNATDNATEALNQLSLKYHQARQQKITSDLLDISNSKL